MSQPNEDQSLPVYALRFTPRARADIAAAHVYFTDTAGEEIADE